MANAPEAGDAGNDALEQALQEATRQALTSEFAKLGIDFAAMHPNIRAVIEREAISSGDVSAQARSFVRVAKMADQYELSDEEKGYAPVKACERHAARKEPGGSVPSSQPRPDDI